MQHKSKIQRIDYIIDKAPALIQLTQQLSQLSSAKAKMRMVAKSLLPDKFEVTDFTQTSLTIRVESSAIAARLRFDAPDIIRLLRHSPEPQWQYLIRLNINILPKTSAITASDQTLTLKSIRPTNLKATLSSPYLSPQNAALLNQTASSCSDEQLKQSLLRLASRISNSKL